MSELFGGRRSHFDNQVELVSQPTCHSDAVLFFLAVWVWIAADYVEHLDGLVITVPLVLVCKPPVQRGPVPKTIVVAGIQQIALGELVLPISAAGVGFMRGNISDIERFPVQNAII